MPRKAKLAQASTEYLIIVGFVTFIIIVILGIAFFYSGGIKDQIKTTQINNFANKIISTAESVFYYGEPSKATVSVYLPDNIKQISLTEDNLIITFQTSSGLNVVAFSSKVKMEGAISISQGLKKIEIIAEEDKVAINQV